MSQASKVFSHNEDPPGLKIYVNHDSLTLNREAATCFALDINLRMSMTGHHTLSIVLLQS
jgi:hypothetical protein